LAWVEGEYHHRPHKGIGETPLDRCAQVCDEVRLSEPGLDLAALFHFEEKRKVARDRTVSLRGGLYEVDAVLVGQTVTLPFDPTRPGRKVEVWHAGRKVGVAKPVDAYANCFVKRDHASGTVNSPEAPPESCACGTSTMTTTSREVADVPQAIRPHPPPLRQGDRSKASSTTCSPPTSIGYAAFVTCFGPASR